MNFRKSSFVKTKTLTLIAFIMLFIILNGCQNSDNPVDATQTNLSTNLLRYERKLEIASNLAKVLAVDLNENDDHRQEVFRKIAIRFDGQFEFLIKEINDNTIDQIQKFSDNLESNKVLSKSVDKGFLQTVKPVKISDIVNEFGDLQIFMPYADKWTDNEIKKKGGLVVAYYPFGTKDTKIKEMIGFNARGEKVIITESNAQSIPYILISQNERASIIKQRLLKSKKFAKAYSSNELKKTFLTDDGWQNIKISGIRPKEVNTFICDTIDIIDTGNPPPGPSTHNWEMQQNLWLKGFEVINVYNYEPYWTNGDPEFTFKISFAPVAAQSGSSFDALQVTLEGQYDGTNVFLSHHYRGGWVYGYYWSIMNRNYLKLGTPMYFYAAEDDGGNLDLSFTVTIPIPGVGGSISCTAKFHDDDDMFGSCMVDQSCSFPITLYIGDIHILLDTE